MAEVHLVVFALVALVTTVISMALPEVADNQKTIDLYMPGIQPQKVRYLIIVRWEFNNTGGYGASYCLWLIADGLDIGPY